MQKSLECLSAKFDEMQNENKELKEILKTQDKDNKMLKERLEALEKIVESQEREKIENNIVISGVDKIDQNENTKEVVTKILQQMSCNTSTIANIQNCYRKNSNNENNPIIITLNNKLSKINILKARKEIGSL